MTRDVELTQKEESYPNQRKSQRYAIQQQRQQNYDRKRDCVNVNSQPLLSKDLWHKKRNETKTRRKRRDGMNSILRGNKPSRNRFRVVCQLTARSPLHRTQTLHVVGMADRGLARIFPRSTPGQSITGRDPATSNEVPFAANRHPLPYS